MPFGYVKKIEDLFSAVLSQFKKYHLFGNLKFNYLGIFQSLELRILVEKILQLNFITNILGCYGLNSHMERESNH